MLKQLFHITQGYFTWMKYKWRFRINDRKVFIVLTGENDRIDYYAIFHLKTYMERKSANKAVILICGGKADDLLREMDFPFAYEVHDIDEKKAALLYDYYCFEEHTDNMVFTYTSRPADNLMNRLLAETGIDEEEAVCLGYYNLRSVPR